MNTTWSRAVAWSCLALCACTGRISGAASTGVTDAGDGGSEPGDAAGCPSVVRVTAAGTYDVSADSVTRARRLECGSHIDFEIVLANLHDLQTDTSAGDFAAEAALVSCEAGLEVCEADLIGAGTLIRSRGLPAGSYRLRADVTGSVAGQALQLEVLLGSLGEPTGPSVHDDPLVRMPGSQPGSVDITEQAEYCLTCHASYGNEAAHTPGFGWQGSMMAHSAQDPLFWAAFTVALQDSIWALGTPNAGDLCLRCHMPVGWLAGRSSPVNASAMRGSDFEGVQCAFCHRMFDPFHAAAAGTRESSDLTGYWDEATTAVQAAAEATQAEDRQLAEGLLLFNGDALYGTSGLPVQAEYVENSSGQYFVSDQAPMRGPYADVAATHTHETLYSRYHKSRFFCGTCHDVSNPVWANLEQADTVPGDGATVLESERRPAFAYHHAERTFSELMLSDFGEGAGIEGTGAFAPGTLDTPLEGDVVGRCQDCHMAQVENLACGTSDTLRPVDSAAHPNTGVALHTLAGGNALIPYILASTVEGSAVYDATNAMLLKQGPAALTLDFEQGVGLDATALLAGVENARTNLENAASLENVAYDSNSGELSLRVVNHTGHKLISGYAEGRRMWINVRAFRDGVLVQEINPFDSNAGTLKGLDTEQAPSSPALLASERHVDSLVYEAKLGSSALNVDESFHFALSDRRYKDNRIPPKGFRIVDATARQAEPIEAGQSRPDMFTAQEYAGGFDEVRLALEPGAQSVEINLYYQTTSREYVEFLRDEINGDATSLPSPTRSGRPFAYVAGHDPFFDQLRAWGDTIWQLWEHNRNVPGAAPVLMAERVVGAVMHRLSVSVNGVTGTAARVTSAPQGIACPGTCDFDFSEMQSVTLTAAPVLGFVFAGWSGDCPGTGTCTVAMSADRNVTAMYSPDMATHTLTLNVGQGGSVTSTPSGIDCGSTCSADYSVGTSVVLQAHPNDGYSVQSWSGAGCSGGRASCTVVVSGDATVRVSFVRDSLPACGSGEVIYDSGGTNGYGRVPIVAENAIGAPTDIAFVPGGAGSFIVLGKYGAVYYFDGGCTPTNTIDVTTENTLGVVRSGDEQGLLAVEFDPSFDTNAYVFFYHTSNTATVNSVTRMTFGINGSGQMMLTNPVRVIDFHKTVGADRHNGGGLVFAPDGTLIMTVGEGGHEPNAQLATNLVGKALRIRPKATNVAYDYEIPAGNMYPSTNARCYASASNPNPCPEIMALGLRNPFRATMFGDVLLMGDVGAGYEEINRVSYDAAPRNFGWQTYDGPASNPSLPNYADPILAYHREDATADMFRAQDPACNGCATGYASIMIGDVYTGNRYDGQLTNHLLHGEFMDGFVRALPLDSTGTPTGPGFHLVHQDGVSAMKQGPDGYIYLVSMGFEWSTNGPNMVWRLVKP